MMEKVFNKKILRALAITVLFAVVLFRFAFGSGVSGKYVNVNYENSRVLPKRSDTLMLFKNGEVRSSIFTGEARYEVESGFFYSKIIIYYDYGKATFSSEVNRDFWGNKIIMVNPDNNHHYKWDSNLD